MIKYIKGFIARRLLGCVYSLLLRHTWVDWELNNKLKDAYWVLHNISTGTKPHEPEDNFPFSVSRWKDDVQFEDGGGATIALFRSEKDAHHICEYLKSIEQDNDLSYYVGHS
jgi:hypothetical protein